MKPAVVGEAVVLAGVVLSAQEAGELAEALGIAAREADRAWETRVNEGAPPWNQRIEWTDILHPGLVFVGLVSQVQRGLIYVRFAKDGPAPGNPDGHRRTVVSVAAGRERPWRSISDDDHRCAACGDPDTVLTGPARECAPGNGCCAVTT